MRAFRRWPGLNCLALMALAAQVCLSFGHVHAHAAPGGRDLTQLQNRTFFPPPAHQPNAPSHHDENGCLICWTIAIAGSVVLHDPPPLALPSAGGLPPPIYAHYLAPAAKTSAFHARGPPANFS